MPSSVTRPNWLGSLPCLTVGGLRAAGVGTEDGVGDADGTGSDAGVGMVAGVGTGAVSGTVASVIRKPAYLLE